MPCSYGEGQECGGGLSSSRRGGAKCRNGPAVVKPISQNSVWPIVETRARKCVRVQKEQGICTVRPRHFSTNSCSPRIGGTPCRLPSPNLKPPPPPRRSPPDSDLPYRLSLSFLGHFFRFLDPRRRSCSSPECLSISPLVSLNNETKFQSVTGNQVFARKHMIEQQGDYYGRF